MTKLPKMSYSRLNTFIQCPMKYKLKYLDEHYEQSDQIHLDLGNILHKVLEIKYRNIINNKPNNFKVLKNIIDNGITDETEKDKGKFILGIKQIKDKYGEDVFSEINSKSGLSYNDKLNTFYDYLENDFIEYNWKPIAVEKEFEFVFDDKITFYGFIDRIDQNEKGDLRVIDYKSSNRLFDKRDLTTPLQMVIYALACENMYNKIPVEYQYDMILLGHKQDACTKGFYKRGVEKIRKILSEIGWCSVTNDYIPKPSPLCFWCEFSETNPDAKWYTSDLCEYYSLWTPNNKTFKKNKEYK